MANAILEQRPTASADLVEFWTLVAFGSMTAVRKRYGVKPRMQDRLAAAGERADRLHGRAIQAIEVDNEPRVPMFVLSSWPSMSPDPKVERARAAQGDGP